MWDTLSEEDKLKVIKANNPNGEATGDFTGRCGRCGSKDLWDDVSMYGCNCCGAMFSNDHAVQVVNTSTGKVEREIRFS